MDIKISKPKGYKTYALLGVFLESLVLTLHNSFFSILEATGLESPT